MVANGRKKIPLSFENRRHQALAHLGIKETAEMAAHIVRLSDHFIHTPGKPTPWKERGTWPAYLSYFLPLNLARLAAVFREVKRFLPIGSIEEVWDFGSGPGTLHWLLEDDLELKPMRLNCLEWSKEAIARHQELIDLAPTKWRPVWNATGKPGAKSLAVFSYSWLEMRAHPPHLDDFEHLLIVEPATRECGRLLMESRAQLIKKGYHPLAPCTHSKPCPLLTHSPRDWCHLRVPFQGPEDWEDLESYLPMKNRTLTYSYLLMSRTIENRQFPNATRVLGDTLKEKGKTRQLICRGPDREFLAWLHKQIDPQMIPSGSLISDISDVEKKSDELRVGRPLTFE